MPAVAQDAVAPISPAPGESPSAPATDSPTIGANEQAPANGARANLNAPAILNASSVRYAGDVIFLSAQDGEFVRIKSDGALLQAREIRIDTARKVLRAQGTVRFERTKLINREIYTPGIATGRGTERQRVPGARSRTENFTEVLSGEELQFDYIKRSGTLDRARVQLSSLDVESSHIEINGTRYTARDVLLRPGGLSDAERLIYGTPPFNLRARSITVQTNARGRTAATVKGAGLYFKNTRLLPIPRAALGLIALGGPTRRRAIFTAIPRVSLSSSDGILATVGLRFPLAADPERATLTADIGLSQRVGFRGGLNLESRSPFGLLALRARRADIITTQLTNRIELDRTPEAIYESPIVPLLRVGKGVGLGIAIAGSAGRFNERLRGRSFSARSSRFQTVVDLTTRLDDRDGVYLDLFRTASRYPTVDLSYRNRGFEIGYAGNMTRNVRGIFSYRASSLSGATPFRFDLVEIPRELRATFDIQVSPRYIVPVDLRYDLNDKSLRDKTFGLLRSYKTFAYGLEYQFARRELNLEVRAGF